VANEMLQELNIENFAIIDKVSVSFNRGFNVLTGETGAGKSILIDAVNVVLGAKFDKNYIKKGKDKSVLEALFDLSSEKLSMDSLSEFGIDCSSQLIISRELYQTGRSVSRINGRIVNVSMLKQVTKSLIDVHGQHEHQSLLDEGRHIELIDAVGNDEYKDLLEDVKNQYLLLQKKQKELAVYDVDEFEKARKIDLYKYQIDEIDSAELKAGEEEKLSEEYRNLYHLSEVRQYYFSSLDALSNSQNGAIDQINSAAGNIQKAINYDSDAKALYDGLQDIVDQLQDIKADLRNKSELIDVDENTLLELDQRMSLISKIKRKYGSSVEDVIEYRDKIEKDYRLLIESEDEIARLEAEIEELETDMSSVCGELTRRRIIIAEELSSKITANLKDLNMKEAEFRVNIEPLDKFSSRGADRIRFEIKTNGGQPFMKLSKIASGGEMSRVMLAFKAILAKADKIPTLIFDEIDTGISGRTAQVVAEKISLIAKNHQILSITHLPQLAAMGDYHYYIYKKNYNNSVEVRVKELSENGRIDEISRLIGGVDLTETTQKHAFEMLKMSKALKVNLVE
jgi:DNA repair protein RecN (Recombination protein N)